MKRWKKAGLCAILAVVMAVCTGVGAVSADTYYTYNNHIFAQGLGCVDCHNAVNSNTYPVLHEAVDAAIADWDWHLGVLNTNYGVNYHFVNFAGTLEYGVPMIHLKTMTVSEYEANSGLSVNSTDSVLVLYYTVSSGTTLQPVEETAQNWQATEIIFLTDRLSAGGYLNDYAALRSLANHEIGHALGLAHDMTDNGVLMYPNHHNRTAYVPTEQDLATVLYLYN